MNPLGQDASLLLRQLGEGAALLVVSGGAQPLQDRAGHRSVEHRLARGHGPHGIDEVFGFPTSWGLGYSIGQFMSNAHETQHVFGVGGVGGSHAYADTATGTTFALTKNRLVPSFDTAEHVAGIVTKAVADD